MSKYFIFRFVLIGIVFIVFAGPISVQNNAAPFNMQPALIDSSNPESLGFSCAPGEETITIYRPGKKSDAYTHCVVLIPFQDHLYAQWQSSKKDEDAAETRVVYCRSIDGVHWSQPETLCPPWDGGIRTNGGWWTDGETLVAYINIWPNNSGAAKGGSTEYMTSSDGKTWSGRKPLLNYEGKPIMGIFEQDPHALPDGRIIGAIHEPPGLVVSPYYTDDPKGISGWIKGRMKNLPFTGFQSRELEPSWFYRSDGSVVMIFRDQQNSFRKLASVSIDRAVTWSTPVVTNVPDSRSKQSAGNLPDGTAFQVNNPSGNKNRFPLVILLSRDGRCFDKAYMLRSGGADLQPLRFAGRYKRAGYSYPKSIIWKKYLYVSYATNKEDAELTRIPLDSLSH
jgi:hypothetical protein